MINKMFIFTYRFFIYFIIVASFIVAAFCKQLEPIKIDSLSQDNSQKISQIYVYFIENKGQVENKNIKFYTVFSQIPVYVSSNGEIIYSYRNSVAPQNSKTSTFTEKFQDLKSFQPIGENKADAIFNYFKGPDSVNQITNLYSYHEISLGQIYNGIECKLKLDNRRLEKVYYLAPDAKPEDIRIEIQNANGLSVNLQGCLEIKTDAGNMLFTRPIAYQEIDGKRNFIPIIYSVNGYCYGFQLGEYRSFYTRRD